MGKIARFLPFFAFFLLLLLPRSVGAYTTGMSASLVIGQPDFTSNSANQGGSPDSQTLNEPMGMTIVGNKLIVADADNNRVLIYNSIPTSNNAAADVVVGQVNFSSNLANQGGSLDADTLSFPYDVSSDGTKLFVADWGNDRVLVYNSIPTTNGASADVVIGQVDMTTDVADTTDSSLIGPGGVYYDSASGKLVITDWGNNRVMVYNSAPTTNGASADVVVGQPNFTSSGSGTSATELSFPVFSKVFNGKLFIVDEFNSRVLIFNSIPATNGASADVVVGKTTMTAVSWEEPGPTAVFLDDTTSAYSDGTRLFIGDGTNSRLMMYNGIPDSSGVAADVVFGQDSFTSNTDNYGGLSASSLSTISGGVVHTGNYLFVSDTGNNRILRYTNESTDSQQPVTSSPPPAVSSSEFPSDFLYRTHTGPTAIQQVHVVSGSSVLGNALTMMANDASTHDIHVKIGAQTSESLASNNIPLPEDQNILRVGEVFRYQSLSAFNGYPILKFDKHVTVILPYDPYRFIGKDPRRLRLAYFDEGTGKWKVMPSNTVLHTHNHTLANTTKIFTYFTTIYR